MSKTAPSLTNVSLVKKNIKAVKNIPKEFTSNAGKILSLDISSNEMTFSSLTQLNVSSNNLTEVPPILVEIQSLKSLIFANNKILVIPEFLTRLSNIEELDFTNNKLNEVPLYIDSFHKLRTLNVSYNTIDRLPKALVNITTLKNFNISGNLFDAFPTPIQQMFTLSSLCFVDNNIVEFPEVITGLTNLEDINFRNGRITHFVPNVLEKMTKLTSLNLKANSLTMAPQVSPLTNLKQLFITDVFVTEHFEFPKLDKATLLETICIENTNFKKFPSLLNLTKLTYVKVERNAFEEILEVPRRCQLLCKKNKISTVTVQKKVEIPSMDLSYNLLIKSPDLSPAESILSLDMSYNTLNCVEKSTFHKGLKEIRLSGNPLMQLPVDIGLSTNLSAVYIADCQLFEISQSVAHSMCNIQVLDISCNRFISYENFQNFLKLEELIASSNNIEQFPPQFLELTKLKKLVINNNKIKVIPESLKNFKNLIGVDFSMNQLQTITVLETIGTLNDIDVSYNFITKAPNYETWTQLRHFDMTGNPLMDATPLSLVSKKIAFLSATLIVQRNFFGDFELSEQIEDKSLKKLPEIVSQSTEIKSKKYTKPPKYTKDDFRFNLEAHSEVGISKSQTESVSVASTYVRNVIGDGVLVALFDGIRGGNTAKFCSAHFVEFFLAKIQEGKIDEGWVKSSIGLTFEKLNEKVKNVEKTDGASVGVMMWHKGKLHVANVGDTRCLVIRESDCLQLTTENLCTEKTEKQRIKNEGGVVDEFGKINGIIGVTKCIGNFDMANFVKCTPDITSYDVTKNDLFSIGINRNIWDVLSNDFIAQVARNFRNLQPPAIASLIKDEARQRGATGNLVVSVLCLEYFYEKNNEQ
ncbi:leucine-rich repeat containing protein, putative [Entamoeba invadens IP1]|uniref:Leucine-rich repeat containing protein, putative n=1 Tax=Entamoeba invadens IP1 TaxID=370355 RepID=A0A0A1U3Y7_ENTIV|nr:leucine-rich repeat containing protein, putative [Entamoeba invadens IP1]ELP88876.1 leucine-rich repeat containing protein, putative [Entamoeba invadens IP1]|eukprot:XP_004255647.1 leucine-rich repeat containing protein, putative [Entamoeba invadens IP1]